MDERISAEPKMFFTPAALAILLKFFNASDRSGLAMNAVYRFLTALALMSVAACAAPRAIWIGGDVHLGNGGPGRLAAIAMAMQPAVGVVNLEGPIGSMEQAREANASLLVNGPGTAAALAKVGIVAAGIANNHAADLPTDTAAQLAAAGVQPFGVTVLTLEGLRVVLTAHDLTASVPTTLAAELTAARARGDVLIATFHVTGPPLFLPRPELQLAVEIALSSGATVIAAHGTHAIAGIERRGDAVIAWGLGNLTFACHCTDEVDGLVLKVELDAHGKVKWAQAVPIDAGLHGANASLAQDPKLQLDLLESLGARPTRRLPDRLEF